jgi:hypothetical protein
MGMIERGAIAAGFGSTSSDDGCGRRTGDLAAANLTS